MTSKVITEAEVSVKSDLTGKDASEVRTFTFNGVTPTLDLTEAEATKLDELLGKYIRKAHAVEVDPSAVREWARANGYTVGARGRIDASITDAFLGRGSDENTDEQ